MTDILIVDDERDIRELISEILIDEGYQTKLCGSADGCLQELKKSVPGLLILDIWLKDNEMDGIDILVKAKRDYPQVPVVIISGHGNIEIAVAAIKQGAYDFIEKPFNIEQLLVVVRRAMEASRLRQENFELKRKGVLHKFSDRRNMPLIRLKADDLNCLQVIYYIIYKSKWS